MSTTTSTRPAITYTRLRDQSWGLRIVGSAYAGQIVTAVKRDGSSKQEAIGRVLWTGQGVTLATIAQTPASSERRYSRSDTVRCRHCHQRTAEGDDWCTVCGRADYE